MENEIQPREESNHQHGAWEWRSRHGCSYLMQSESCKRSCHAAFDPPVDCIYWAKPARFAANEVDSHQLLSKHCHNWNRWTCSSSKVKKLCRFQNSLTSISGSNVICAKTSSVWGSTCRRCRFSGRNSETTIMQMIKDMYRCFFFLVHRRKPTWSETCMTSHSIFHGRL